MRPLGFRLAVVAAVLLTIESSAAAQAPARVTIQNFAFQPGELTVAAGTTVQWTNRDTAPHQVAFDNGAATGPVMGDGDTFTFAFSAPGRISYHCGIHSTMTGVVIVQ